MYIRWNFPAFPGIGSMAYTGLAHQQNTSARCAWLHSGTQLEGGGLYMYMYMHTFVYSCRIVSTQLYVRALLRHCRIVTMWVGVWWHFYKNSQDYRQILSFTVATQLWQWPEWIFSGSIGQLPRAQYEKLHCIDPRRWCLLFRSRNHRSHTVARLRNHQFADKMPTRYVFIVFILITYVALCQGNTCFWHFWHCETVAVDVDHSATLQITCNFSLCPK